MASPILSRDDKYLKPKAHLVAALAARQDLTLPSRALGVTVIPATVAVRVYVLVADAAADARYILCPSGRATRIEADCDFLSLKSDGAATVCSVVTSHQGLTASQSQAYP